ncbi:MAG: hypothetical protein ISF22_06680 [Methanomassiliicoccus sp.]|nr:hypothetical protein [Methanomassiliicoccus sp.]
MFDKLRSEIRNEPIVLAHHPLCGRFEDHFITIRGRKVCRGCLTVYPTAAAGIAILAPIGISDFSVLFALSLFLFIMNLPRLIIHRSGRTNLFFNIVLGLCLSATALAMFNCPADLRLAYYPFVVVTYLLFMAYRGHRMMSGCRKCPDHHLYPACFTALVTTDCEQYD